MKRSTAGWMGEGPSRTQFGDGARETKRSGGGERRREVPHVGAVKVWDGNREEVNSEK